MNNITEITLPHVSKVPATAPGQYLGYSLQQTMLATRLRQTSAGSTCSLEVLDDVAVQAEDGTTHLTQSKSSLTDNPVADRAVSLWKTLYNWLELVKLGLVNPDTTTFEIYVSRTVSGGLVDAFYKSITTIAANQALTSARDLIWGAAPARADRANLSTALQKYANPVLEADENLVIPIIRNFRLTCSDSGTPIGDFVQLIANDPVPINYVPYIVNNLLGWVKVQVDQKIEKGLPAFILKDDFHREYISFRQKIDRDVILTCFAPRPTEDQMKEKLHDTFVHQLDLIEEDYDEKLEAISDLLMASYDRVKWSESGDLHKSSFDDLDESLRRTWRNLKKINDLANAAKPAVDQGKLLYYECKKHRATVQQMTVTADYFTPGCFHLLADVPHIGWHPQYATLLPTKHEEAV
jgi:predicted DNA-binding ribbon-helix-helix protein